jgi:hypothetical protein
MNKGKPTKPAKDSKNLNRGEGRRPKGQGLLSRKGGGLRLRSRLSLSDRGSLNCRGKGKRLKGCKRRGRPGRRQRLRKGSSWPRKLL